LRNTILRFLLFGTILAWPGTANVVVNPGFETGDLTSWITSTWQVIDLNPHSGTFGAVTLCSGPQCTDPADPLASFIAQSIATVAGGSYTLSFWLNTGAFPTEGSELKVLWAGQKVGDFVNVDTGNAYRQIVIPNLIAAASTTDLRFFGRQDPSVLYLDDIDVERVVQSGVPEPGTVVMALSAVVGLLLKRNWPRMNADERR
jgi:hypothetical protein